MRKVFTLRTLWEYFALTFACFVFAFAWEGFMIPNGMSAGGMMGLCTVVEYATGGFIQAQYSYFAINTALIIVAVLALGIGFGFKTIYCIIMSSLMMQLLDVTQALHCIPGEFFYVQERLLIPVIAGALEAVGIGLTLRFGGSTGGTDIIALMVNKYWPVSLSSIFAVTDFIVVCLLLFLPDKAFSDMVYGLVEIVVFSLMIDFVVGGKKTSYQLMVFSNKYEQIADYIINDMERGATVLRAQGWYSKLEKNVLLVIISRNQLPSISKAIKEIDPKTFISVSPTSNVYGEGFEEIRAGLSLKKKKQDKQ